MDWKASPLPASPTSTRTVQFFFGVGSRYSYLAATQVPRLAAETGAHFEWRALNGRELIESAGADPFQPSILRGQYDPSYRTEDAMRWAAHYGVPYKEPKWERINWPHLALACVAAGLMGAAEPFAQALFAKCFGAGARSMEDSDLEAVAKDLGLDAFAFKNAVGSAATADRHWKNLHDAARAGAFGVPTFVLDDGQLFWGQDRMPLLRHALMQGRSAPEVYPFSFSTSPAR